MEITTELVEHLAELSRLKFNGEEIETFKKQFAGTLEQIDKLNKADLTNVNLEKKGLDAKTELRADEKKEGLTVQQVVKNAPESLGNSVLIPVEII